VLTAGARQDWTGTCLSELQLGAQQWAAEAGLRPDGVAVALWLAGMPPHSPAVQHLGRLASQGVSQEHLRLLAVGLILYSHYPLRGVSSGGGGSSDRGGSGAATVGSL